ncbi:hypothetical protein BsWGS_10979 [Bradybaena similaris]
MAVINAQKLAGEWYRRSSHYRNFGAISDDDITVNASIAVPRQKDKLRWTKISPKIDEQTFHKQVDFDNRKSQALAQISAPAGENFTRVIVEKGQVKGLHNKPTISLPRPPHDVGNVFGDSINIDPNETVLEVRQSKQRGVNGPVLSEKSIGRTVASAIIQYKKKESVWSFTCKDVMMKANAIFNTGRVSFEYNFADIIRNLKDWQDDDALDDIKVEQGKILFTISGEVVFRWDCEYRVQWQ